MHDVDSELIDPDTNAVAVLTNKTGGNLTSVLRFYSVQGNVHNNTAVECIDNFNEESTNVKIVMAGIHVCLYYSYVVCWVRFPSFLLFL